MRKGGKGGREEGKKGGVWIYVYGREEVGKGMGEGGR